MRFPVVIYASCHKSTGTKYGGLAQLGERLICIQEVNGSIPLFSTIRRESDSTVPKVKKLFPDGKKVLDKRK